MVGVIGEKGGAKGEDGRPPSGGISFFEAEKEGRVASVIASCDLLRKMSWRGSEAMGFWKRKVKRRAILYGLITSYVVSS